MEIRALLGSKENELRDPSIDQDDKTQSKEIIDTIGSSIVGARDNSFVPQVHLQINKSNNPPTERPNVNLQILEYFYCRRSFCVCIRSVANQTGSFLPNFKQGRLIRIR